MFNGMFKQFILALMATLVISDRTRFSSTPKQEIDCGSGLKYPSKRMCDVDLKCPNEADKILCHTKKLKPFICGRGFELSLAELCISNSSCPNNLDKFVCQSTRHLRNTYVFVANQRDSMSRVMVQLTKTELCPNDPAMSILSVCPYDRLADRTLFYSPNASDTLTYSHWMIRDMDEFLEQGSSQFNSTQAFTYSIHVEYGNFTVYTLSHPNHFAKFFSTDGLAELDTSCPEKIDEAICSALPALKKRLLEGHSSKFPKLVTEIDPLKDSDALTTSNTTASSSDTSMISLLSLFVFLVLSLYYSHTSQILNF